MSDSESDLLPSNVYTFQNESTAFCAKGPNVNSTNLTGLSFRNNFLNSTMQMPRNFERQRYRELSFEQRSMSYRRETSPMSMYSDMRPKNFHHSFYPGGMSSQRSMYNGRSGSPMSMRSMDSNASSVSAVDIAMAFKNANFNKYDLKMIKEAYNKLMKRKVRKRVEKRRNMRLFLKGYRRKSGYDSGEQGSDSSISSDDCRLTHSAMYKNNMFSCRSTRTDITDFRRSIKESNMYKDCTNHFKSNAFKNMFSASPNATGSNDRVNSQTITQNLPTLNQKERFKNGFLLPSQRFNKSVASVPIPEKERAQTKPTFNCTNIGKSVPPKTNHIHETDSDQEEIFSEVTIRENSNHNTETANNIAEGKRSLEIEENQCSDKKRTKLSSPKKQNKAKDKIVLNKSKNILRQDNINNNNKKTGDFEFVKPQLPLRKSAPGKFKDKLISKSAPPLVDVIVSPPKVAPEEHVQNTVRSHPPPVSTKDDKINTDETTEEHVDTIHHSNSDMSMRPSFIKRKLFSQKMDVTESKNLSLEGINVNSPETNVYSAIQKEKHKARKLVTNQSCLNRDVIQENNNLLDLIHKIVPADQMNITNVTNKTSLSSRQSKDNKQVDDDKWDVTSIISTCNNDDVSDTYTDEEIFHDNNKPNKNTLKEKPVPKPQTYNDFSIVLERIPETKMVVKNKVADCKLPTPKKAIDNKNKSVQNCVKSFWDTDFESDLESPAPKRWADLREKTINTINSIPERDISFSNQNTKSMQVSKKISDTHNTTSLSECLKSNVNSSVLDYTMGKLKKYNINRNLTIKAFRTPKIKITENNKKEKKADTITMPPDKNELAKNRKHQTIDVKEKQTEVKQNTTEIRNTKVVANKVVEPAKKTKNTNKKAKNVETIKKKPEIKKAIENVTSTKELVAQNKVKINSVKPQIPDVQNVNNAKTRVLRTPKKHVCCDDSLEIERKQQKKSTENMKENVNPKCNTSKSTKPHKKVRSPGNHKTAEHPTILELEPMNRTLRTRKIDLSSSLNTTNENGPNITIKSLRSRKINLSSSINNSTLEGNLTIVKKKLLRTPVKKPISKIRNEVKRPRMVKNNSVKG